MDDAVSMRLVERIGDLNRVAEGLIERQRTLVQSLGERLPFQKLHDQEVNAILLPDVEHGTNMRVAECRQRLGLTLEPLSQVGIAGDMRGQDLDGDGAIETRILGFVDLTHATSP